MRSRKQVKRRQVRRPKKKVREKFFFEDTPGVDLDFIEIPLPTREGFFKEEDTSGDDGSSGGNKQYGYKNLDEFILEHANRYIRQKDRPYGDLLKDKRRAEKLQYKLDRAASLYFTEVQFKIYVLRYKCGVKEKAIAHQMGRNQSYVAHVLRNINTKLKDLLRLSKRKRSYKKHFRPPTETPPKNNP